MSIPDRKPQFCVRSSVNLSESWIRSEILHDIKREILNKNGDYDIDIDKYLVIYENEMKNILNNHVESSVICGMIDNAILCDGCKCDDKNM